MLVRIGARNFQQCIDSTPQVNHIVAFLRLCQAALRNDRNAIDVLLCPNEDDIVDNPLYQELVGFRLILGPLIETGKVSLSLPMKIALSCGNVSTAGHILLRSSKHPSTGMLDWHDLDMAYVDTDWLDLPDAVGKLWFIGLSSNMLKSVPVEVFNFPNLVKLQLRNNKITDLPGELLTMPKLKELDVSFNKISSLPVVLLQHTISESLRELNISNNKLVNLPSYFQHSSLQSLDIGCNKLQTVPECILHMRRLHTLSLSGNIGLQHIPYELGMLRNLSLLSLDDLPYAHNLPSRDKAVPLEFLKKRARGLQHVRHFDVMLIGSEQYPDLLELMQKALATESKRKAFSFLQFSSKRQFLRFQRIFALPSSVYLILWDCHHGQQPNDLLSILVHLSVYAPHAVVIVSACWEATVTSVTEASVREQVNSSWWSDLSSRVKVVCTCVDREAIVSRSHSVNGLMGLLAKEAGENMTIKTIPSSYFFLTDVIRKEANKFLHTENKAPLISEWDLWEIIRTKSNDDLVGHKELPMVISFLSTVGCILQLPCSRSDAVDYYVLDRQFLLDLVTPLLASPKGTMCSESGFFLPTCLIDLFESPYLQNPLPYPLHVFASQQGLAILVTSSKYLVPSMLRTRNTGFLSSSEFSSQYQIRRAITFRLTPSSFWGKLIAHLLINVSQLLSSSGFMQIASSSKGARVPSQIENIPGEELANWTYWRSGIIVWTGGDLVCSVEAIPPITKPIYREGLEIRVANTPMGVRAMNLVTATISSLLINWYYAIWETVEFAVRCPSCVKDRINQPTFFSCIECCRSFCHGKSLQCCKHGSGFLPANLVPDLLQPPGECEESICLRALFVHPSFLDVSIQEKSTCLSQAPAETVFRGKFNGADVAVKVFPPVVPNPARTHSATKRHLNFFHEFSILNHLSNTVTSPFIINMTATSCDPLCLVFPHASYGSLEEVILESHIVFPTFLRVRIVQQVSTGLEALHSAQVIHRHVCLANILVFSLSIDNQVNVKIAGFSEATIGLQQGLATGLCGAFPATEMCQNRSEYDERVDTFAFAFTAYEILTRKKLYSMQGVPFQTASANDNRPSLAPINTIVPHFSPLLQRCWDKDLSKRPFLVEVVEFFQDPLNVVTRSGQCINSTHEIYTTAVKYSRNKKGMLERDIFICSGVLSKDDSALLSHLSYPGLQVKDSTSLPSRFVICMCCTRNQLWVSFQQRFVRVYSTFTLEYICEIKLSHHTLAMTATPSSVYLGLENGEVHMFKHSQGSTPAEAFIFRNICGGKPVKALETLDYSILCVSKNLCYRLNPTTLDIEQQLLTVSETEVKCAVMARDSENECDFLWVGFRRSQQIVVFNGEDGKAIYGVNCCEVLKKDKAQVWVQTMCVVLDMVWVGMNTGHILCFSAFSQTPLLQTHFSIHNGNVRQILLLHPDYLGRTSYVFPDVDTNTDSERKQTFSGFPSLSPVPKCLPVLSCGQGIQRPLPEISVDGVVSFENVSPSENGLFAVVLEGLDRTRTEELESKSKRKPLPYMEGHRQRYSQYFYEIPPLPPRQVHSPPVTNHASSSLPRRMGILSPAMPTHLDQNGDHRAHARNPIQDPELAGWEVVSFSDAPNTILISCPNEVPSTAEKGLAKSLPNASNSSLLRRLGRKSKNSSKSPSPAPNVQKEVSPSSDRETNPIPTPLDDPLYGEIEEITSRTNLRQMSPGIDDSGDESDPPYIQMRSASPIRPRLHTVGVVTSKVNGRPLLGPFASVGSRPTTSCTQQGQDSTVVSRLASAKASLFTKHSCF